MFPRLATRVLSRAYALSLPNAAVLRVVDAYQPAVARTFLTTASVADPAAKTKTAEKADATKPRKPRRSSEEVQAEQLAKAKAREEAARMKAKEAQAKLKDRERKAKLREKEKQKEKQKREAAKTKAKAKPTDPDARLKAPLRSIKVKRSELPPKQPGTAYTFFAAEQFKELHDSSTQGNTGPANRDAFGKLSSQIAERWRSLSEEEKKPYYEMQEKSAEEYRRAAEEWYRNTNPRIVRALKVQGHQLPKAKPSDLKRPMAPFAKFSLENRDKVQVPEGLSAREDLGMRMKLLGEMWQQLPEKEKAGMLADYAKEMEAYHKRKEERQQSLKA
ncbi:hypothetical protein BV20DRAFT_970692 [Pilatotrama ljubarskyi]|nr:hypothetical protein BV20DRAFT_970692 [Pilatotrama ljubarskyi]